MVRFFLPLILLVAPLGVSAASCPQLWAKISRTAKEVPHRLAIGVMDLQDHAADIWTEDYLGAWRKGKTLPDKYYLFIQRALYAPRSRNKDLLLREAEAKKFNVLPALLDPILDGSTETINKLRVLAGKPPMETRLSNLSSLAGGVVTTGIYAGIYDYYRDKVDSKDISSHLNKGELGLSYLEEWRKRGAISAQDEIKIYNRHNKIMEKWAAGIHSGGKRVLPPRLTQFVKEGALLPEETTAFEAIALKAFRAASKGEGATEEERVRNSLRKQLASDPRFNGKAHSDLDLLMHFFDPPVFLGSEEGIGWLEKVRDGKAPPYEENLRQHSDLFLYRAVAKGEGDIFRAIRALDQPEEIDSAILAYLSIADHHKEEIEARKKWAESVGFPPEKMYIVSRAEFPLYRTSPIHFYGKDGTEKALEKEDDFWGLLAGDPGFSDLKEKWRKSPDDSELDTMLEVRHRAAEIHLVQALQNDRRKDGKLLDPVPAQFCLLMNKAASFAGPVDTALEKLAAKDDDTKLFCRYFFAIQRWRSVGAGTGNWNKPFAPEAEYCAAPGALEKFAASLKVNASQVREALQCGPGE